MGFFALLLSLTLLLPQGGGAQLPEALPAEPSAQHPADLPNDLPRRDEVRILLPSDPALQGRLRILHWPGAEARAARLLAAIEASPGLPGIPPEFPTRADLYLAPDGETWEALTGGAVPEWGAGVAIPSRGVAVIPLEGGPGTTLTARDATALHEWAHLGLHESMGGLRIPRWFDEGYAQWASRGWDAEEGWRLRLALARGGAPPLDSLTLVWPAGRTEAEIAYLLSASAVEYLVQGSGVRGVEVFLDRWRESGDFEGAFRATFGFTTEGFERRWADHVRSRYGWILILQRTAAFWLFAGVAILFLVRSRRIRDRERMARLRASDPPDRPAYWEGPPTPPIGGFTSDQERAGRG